jgi:RHS repeat-associated protein
MAFTYNGSDLSTVRDAFNRTLTFSSTSGRINSVTDSSTPTRTVSYGYDSNGNLTTYTDPEQKVWSYVYSDPANHRITGLRNPYNTTTVTNTYDSLGRMMTQTVPRQTGNATYNFFFSGFVNQEEDPNGNRITYYYDQKGREYAKKDAFGNMVKKVFDGQDHTVSITNPRLYTTSFLYEDGKNNLTKIIDALSHETTNTYETIAPYRLTDTIDPLGHLTHFTYDGENHLLSTSVYPAQGQTITNSATYYGNGFKNTATDGRNTVATFTYDSYGNPRTSQIASHNPVTYTYDTIGRLTGLTDQVESTTGFVYDKRNLLTSKTDPLSRSSSFVYDNAGRLQSRTDRKGQTTTYAYTPTDKIDTITYPGGSTVHFTYNQLDQLTSMVDSVGTTSYGYDAAGRLTSSTNPHSFAVSYHYDAAGNLDVLTYPGNKEVRYTYDELNRLKTAKIMWLAGEPTATYYYDPAGRLDYLTNFNGTLADYSYDNANRLTSLDNRKSDSTILATYAFTLDGNGNRTNTVQTEQHTNLPAYSASSYTYNLQKNRLLSAGADSFTYDNEGQLATGYGSAYTFDHEHRLIAIGTDQLTYDVTGKRLQATRNGVVTRYIYDASGNLLAEADGSNNIIRYYIHGAGLLGAVTPSNQLYCYHFNATGHAMAMTDATQTVVNKYSYDAYGTVTNQQETVTQPFKYVGQLGVMAEPNGFYYMRARYYDPQVGRFISEDPIGFDGGDENLYAYVGNNPVMGVDPSGLKAGDWWDLPANLARAQQIAGEELARRPNSHNDIGDAMRHAEWQRRTTQETNAFTAWLAGTGHEIEGMLRGQPMNEMLMDLHNNSVGRDAGRAGSSVSPSNLWTLPLRNTEHNPYSRGCGN